MRWSIPLSVLLCACPSSSGPDLVEPIEVAVSCVDSGDTPVWLFGVAASGPVDSSGADLRVFEGDLSDDFAFTLQFEGSGNGRTDFSLEAAGTPLGEEPEPGDVPFACEEEQDARIVFCLRNAQTLEVLCWACEDGGTIPAGADAWASCG